MQSHPPRRSTPGFTLVELLVVIVVLVFLLGALGLLSTHRTARRTARAAECASHVKDLAVTLSSNSLDYDGALLPFFPDARAAGENSGYMDWVSSDLLWVYYSRQGWGHHRNWHREHIRQVLENLPQSALTCPADEFAWSDQADPLRQPSYGYNVEMGWGEQCAKVMNKPTRLRYIRDFDRPNETIIFGDSYHPQEQDAHPANVRVDSSIYLAYDRHPDWPGNIPNTHRHPGGANLAWLDVHVSKASANDVKEYAQSEHSGEKYWAAIPTE